GRGADPHELARSQRTKPTTLTTRTPTRARRCCDGTPRPVGRGGRSTRRPLRAFALRVRARDEDPQLCAARAARPRRAGTQPSTGGLEERNADVVAPRGVAITESLRAR